MKLIKTRRVYLLHINRMSRVYGLLKTIQLLFKEQHFRRGYIVATYKYSQKKAITLMVNYIMEDNTHNTWNKIIKDIENGTCFNKSLYK